MYSKKQKYTNSCFPCALQIALVNVGNLSPDYGDKLEDDFNSEMLNITGNTHDLNSNAPNEEQVLGIISSLGLPLGNGFLVGPTELSGCEQQYADRINNALTANENVAFVIGFGGNGHAFAIFKDSETGLWYLADPRDDGCCDDGNISAIVYDDGSFALSGRYTVGGNFIMMVSREH